MSSVVEGVDNGAGYGVAGISNTGAGVLGEAKSGGIGVRGLTRGGGIGVLGESTRGGIGVDGQSDGGTGVRGSSRLGGIGVEGSSDTNYGVTGQSVGKAGVAGISTRGEGVYGKSFDGIGVYGEGSVNSGVVGISVDNSGVTGISRNRPGVYGDGAIGVEGVSVDGIGVYGIVGTGLAALFEGNVRITGSVEMLGPVNITGPLTKPLNSFKIDHPLDPANKYLYHSSVESPDMKNVYDGMVTLDDKGEAEIELPDWFGALNKDFRYQLTAIGAPGPNLYISEEISDDAATTSNYNTNKSRFKIAGGTSGMKVSWQVTGIRKDPWANAHRISVEEDKPAKERGYYTYPELYGQPEEKGIISRLLAPEIEKRAAAHK
jgi:hypothetical protein